MITIVLTDKTKVRGRNATAIIDKLQAMAPDPEADVRKDLAKRAFAWDGTKTPEGASDLEILAALFHSGIVLTMTD